jgi:hypothetical protein
MDNNCVRIYMAGKVAKGDEIGTVRDWRDEYVQALSTRGVFEFISPEDPSLDESKPIEVFGHDCHHVKSCDVLIIDASSKLGAGTAQEMVIAKYFRKVVLTMLPKDTHHRRSNLKMYDFVVPDWIHPFVYAMSDEIFDSPRDLCDYLAGKGPGITRQPRRDLSFIDDAIDAYEQSRRP